MFLKTKVEPLANGKRSLCNSVGLLCVASLEYPSDRSMFPSLTTFLQKKFQGAVKDNRVFKIARWEPPKTLDLCE